MNLLLKQVGNRPIKARLSCANQQIANFLACTTPMIQVSATECSTWKRSRPRSNTKCVACLSNQILVISTSSVSVHHEAIRACESFLEAISWFRPGKKVRLLSKRLAKGTNQLQTNEHQQQICQNINELKPPQNQHYHHHRKSVFVVQSTHSHTNNCAKKTMEPKARSITT